MKLAVGILLVAAALTHPLPALAGLVFGPVHCFNGHCYQGVFSQETNACDYWDATDLTSFVRERSHNGMPAHLLTIESQAEADFLRSVNLFVGLVGAARSAGGDYRWSVGPSLGQPVDFIGAPFEATVEDGCAHTRLYLAGGAYYGRPTQGFVGPARSGCAGCVFGTYRAVYEYEPDLVPIALDSFQPAAGAAVVAGTSVPLRWRVHDAWPGVLGTRVAISRTGPAGHFTQLFEMRGDQNDYQILANELLPQFVWEVTGPATSDAWLRFTASDGNLRQVSALVGPIAIVEQPTAATPASWGRLKTLYR